MTSFKRTLIPSYPRVGVAVTSDTLYWRKLGFPFILKESNSINDIHFSEEDPFYFCACSSAKVQILNPSTNQVYCNLSRSKSEVLTCRLRADARLLIAGEHDAVINVFDVSRKDVLRKFKGHSGPVRKCCFMQDEIHFASYSDDKTICVWDIPTSTRVHRFSHHEDYVRAGCVNPIHRDILFSGSYDHTVKMYDTRMPDFVWSIDHGSPVEALLVLPSGGIVISAGGVDIKVWDAVSGGELVAKMTQHHKTVTCLCLASGGTRFMSGSLDCHVNVYDLATFRSVHTLNYESPVLSLGVAPDDSSMAVGMTDGSLSVQRRIVQNEEESTHERSFRTRRKSSYKYLLQAKSFREDGNNIKVSKLKRKVLTSYDKHLKEFNSSLALDDVLQTYGDKQAELVVAVLKELIIRKTIRSAVAGKSSKKLCTLLRFIKNNIGDKSMTGILVDVANTVLDVYWTELDETCGTKTKSELEKLHRYIERYLNYVKEVFKLRGSVEILLAATSATPPKTTTSSSNESNDEGSKITGCNSESESNMTKISSDD